MSLLFGNATSDRVDLGTDTRLTALSQFTIWAWVYLTSLVDNRTLMTKRGDGVSVSSMSLAGTGGEISCIAFGNSGGPSSHIATTSDAPLATNVWSFVAYVCNWGVSNAIYAGTLNTLATLRALGGSDQVGTTQQPDVGGPLVIGNRHVNDRAWTGRIGMFGLVPHLLTLGEIRALQDDPRGLGGPLYWLGQDGASVVKDRSGGGIDGTVTGATVAPFVPIGRRRVTTTALQRAALW